MKCIPLRFKDPGICQAISGCRGPRPPPGWKALPEGQSLQSHQLNQPAGKHKEASMPVIHSIYGDDVEVGIGEYRAVVWRRQVQRV